MKFLKRCCNLWFTILLQAEAILNLSSLVSQLAEINLGLLYQMLKMLISELVVVDKHNLKKTANQIPVIIIYDCLSHSHIASLKWQNICILFDSVQLLTASWQKAFCDVCKNLYYLLTHLSIIIKFRQKTWSDFSTQAVITCLRTWHAKLKFS